MVDLLKTLALLWTVFLLAVVPLAPVVSAAATETGTIAETNAAAEPNPEAAPDTETKTAGKTDTAQQGQQESGAANEWADTWIIKWKNGEDPAFGEISIRMAEYPELNAVVAAAKRPEELETWVQRWRESPYVEYIHPNHKVQIDAKPNDPSYSLQSYLNQIGAEKAWDQVRGNRDIIIAVVDTGVDLNHPDLKSNLTSGVNLIHPAKPPQDDHGHGTNVAGVLAAVGNNRLGVAGVLWNAKIMPVKALEEDGSGDEGKLGEGVLYAVDHGAKIVVLSLGLYKYSPFMRDVVEYAEKRGTLLVAAAGNDGQAVKYPAAYPTVLAVGGVDRNNQVVSHSNYGQEMDVVAPFKVYTTSLGGGYNVNEGTSMAAPQVAAAAAMIWSKYPDMKPYQIRNLIRQTAQDIGSKGWDSRSGYGLLRIDRALTEQYKQDMYENNNTADQAKRLPIGSMSSASLSGSDADWFVIDAPYRGEIVLRIAAEQTDMLRHIQVAHYANRQSAGTSVKNAASEIRFPVEKGLSYIRLNLRQTNLQQPVVYHIIPEFQIYRDDFEDNDRQYKAYSLPARSQTITGTFHQIDDQDWFVLSLDHPGTLQLELTVDTYRIDPAVTVEKAGEKAYRFDEGSWGMPEYSPAIEVFPGKYYINVSNVISQESYPVAGEYKLRINVVKKYVDPNEPNDKPYEALTISMNTPYEGVFANLRDQDWFKFKVAKQSYTRMELSNIPNNRIISMTVFDNDLKQLYKTENKAKQTSAALNRVLPPGTYYIKLTADQPFDQQMYRLKVTQEELVSGFRDISRHWARDVIAALKNRGIVNGYGDYTFRPDQRITRAEAVVILAKALNWDSSAHISYSDVKTGHWAYSAIAKAAAANAVSGYPNGTFGPNRDLTRSEMAAIIGNVLGLKGEPGAKKAFADVASDYWANPILLRMKEEGWIAGYPDGTFQPTQPATRAEFAAMVHKLLQSGR
jgi:subtilisin family serine protease